MGYAISGTDPTQNPREIKQKIGTYSSLQYIIITSYAMNVAATINMQDNGVCHF